MARYRPPVVSEVPVLRSPDRFDAAGFRIRFCPTSSDLDQDEESFDFQRDRVKVHRDFRKKFAKVLAGKRVARFYQIDSKIDAIIDFDIARTIPLVR